jgi:GR25 family glycosyltransferase involved in LPS biosynthesis
MFDTYIPHYTKLTERKPHIEMELNKLGINDAKFITDFDGDSLTGEDTTNYITESDYFHVAVEPSVRKLGIDRIEQTTLKNSEISLILKHFQAIDLFLSSELDHALILEDDVNFHYNISMQQVIDEAPDFDVLFLGGPLNIDFFNVKEIYRNYFRAGHPSTNTTSSIVYSRPTAEKLSKLYDMMGFCLPLDWQLNYFFEKLDMSVWHCYPKLCGQLSGTEFRSSIQ